MSVSEGLTKLADRAKAAEDHAAAAKTEGRAELEQKMSTVKASAEKGAMDLQAQAQAASTNVSSSWEDVQRSWDAHVSKVHRDIDQRKAEFNAANASDRADWSESDAMLAIDYAYGAVVEAEYAVLDAILARREAEEAVVAASR